MSSNIRINRICKHCGEVFVAKTFKTQFCSHSCNSKDYKKREKIRRMEESQEEYKSDLKNSKSQSMNMEELKSKIYLTWQGKESSKRNHNGDLITIVSELK